MIGRLVGKIVGEEPTGGLLLDVRGVGYELACPIGTVGRAKKLNQEEGEELVLHVHTNLRQDNLELFGFSSPDERTAFRQLVNVPNVGPRLAIAVLNVLPADELAQVIDAEDKVRLGKVPGVGKKTAERLVLELRGKLVTLTNKQGEQAKNPSKASGASADKLVAALTGLGYRGTEAEKAAKKIFSPGKDLSSLLREALDFLSS